MPRLSEAPTTATGPKIEFVASRSMDLMNAMFFTSLAANYHGLEDTWPAQLRREMAPELLAELDFLYDFPAGDPAIMGILGDNLFAHLATWANVDALIEYIQAMPSGMGDGEADAGIQGLVYQATFRYYLLWDHPESEEYVGLPPSEAIERRLRSLSDRDADAVMALYDRPQELRERMIGVIQRFYRDHYQREMAKRLPSLERSVAAHHSDVTMDGAQLASKLTGRDTCLDGSCPGPFAKLIFTPSMDMGPYVSCSVVGNVHGLFYPLEPEFLGESAEEEAETARLARLYKALADEQRLRILRMLREREMYAQEIVERTGLHQSVVSRHLAFLKAVGLLESRRQNNMKFFSLNAAARQQLESTLELFLPRPTGQAV